MPKLEAKAIQREIEQDLIWPVYWLYGPERMKTRELLKRIQAAVCGQSSQGVRFGDETLEGAEVSAEAVLDSAHSMTLGGGTRFITVRDAHLIKESERLSPLLGPRRKREELECVCVFISKDLDGRKKFSKALVEGAAVVACDEVEENDRDAWIQYLLKRRGGMAPSAEVMMTLRCLDPWSLDIVDQELEKISLHPDALLKGSHPSESFTADSFLDAFFRRKTADALQGISRFADHVDESLPLLGLLGWNVRQLALYHTGSLKLSPFLMERVRSWAALWSPHEILALQTRLTELDFCLKQKPLLPIGLWTELVLTTTSKQ